jgi:hypothetical protein
MKNIALSILTIAFVVTVLGVTANMAGKTDSTYLSRLYETLSQVGM